MAVPFSNTKLRVPSGFQNILEGLAREVLRDQPANVYEFGAKYFENLLKVRKETGRDPTVHGAKQEDRAYNNHSFKKPGADASGPQQQDAALKIQTQYRQHAAQQQVQDIKVEDAAVKIQAGFRGYIDRQEVKKRKEGKTSPDKAPEPEEEVDIDLTDPEVENAAVKIQAQFKGYKARKEIQTKQAKIREPESEPEEKDEEEIDIDLNDPEVSKAALKIQSGFRGHMARQEIRQKKRETEGETLPRDEDEAVPPQPDEQAEAEEEVDIDLTDPDVEKAAVKIQAGFKGYKARKSRKVAEDQDAQEAETLKPAAKQEPLPTAAQYEPKNKRREEEKEEEEEKAEAEKEEVDIDLTDPDVEKAATKIQAGFKGYKTRKELQHGKEQAERSEGEVTAEVEVEEEVKVKGKVVDYEDPEVERAALKIQAGYRGYRARRRVRGLREERQAGPQGGGEEETPREVAEEEAGEVNPTEEGENAAVEAEADGAAEETAGDDGEGGEGTGE